METVVEAATPTPVASTEVTELIYENVSDCLKANNPIDNTFNTYGWKGSTTLAINRDAALYKTFWQEEMLHAYDLLIAKAHPSISYPKETTIASRDAYLTFVNVYANVAGLVENSNAFGDEFNEAYDEQIYSGTIMPITMNMVCAQKYREHTFELYDLLDVIGVEPDFITDVEDLKKQLLE